MLKSPSKCMLEFLDNFVLWTHILKRFSAIKGTLIIFFFFFKFVFVQIVINAPLWYYAIYMLRSRFLTQKTKRKFVFARSTNVTKTLLK